MNCFEKPCSDSFYVMCFLFYFAINFYLDF